MPNVIQLDPTSEADGLQRSLSLKELLALDLPAAKWTVESLIGSGAITMVSALWGQRKSWLCQHIALCVAGGSQVFGRFAVEKTGVMIVNEEDGLQQLQERMRLLEPQSEELPVYFRVGQDFKLERTAVAALITEMKERGVGLVIFDSLRAIHGARENDSDEMQGVMNLLKPIVREGIAVVFTHHSRKPAQGQQAGDQNGAETRGSGAINAAVYGHLEVRKARDGGGEYVVVTQPKNKGQEQVAPFKVRVEKTVGGGLSFTYAGAHAAENPNDKVDATVLGFLSGAGRWMAVKEICAQRLAGEGAVRDALRRLVGTGRVETKENKDLVGEGEAALDTKHNAKLYRALGADGGVRDAA